jgi:hypothetical protein
MCRVTAAQMDNLINRVQPIEAPPPDPEIRLLLESLYVRSYYVDDLTVALVAFTSARIGVRIEYSSVQGRI